MNNQIKINYNKKYRIFNYIITSFFILIFIMPVIMFASDLIKKKIMPTHTYLIAFVYLIFIFICCNNLLKRILWINKCEIVLDDEKVKMCYLKKQYRNKGDHIPLKYKLAPFADGSHDYSYIKVLRNDIIYYADITDCYMTEHDINIITNKKKYKLDEDQFSKKNLEMICNEINKRINN